MSYTEGLSNALTQINQIQSVFSTALTPGNDGAGDFESVMQQISSISTLAGGGTQSASGGGADLSGIYGWPLDEGKLSAAQLAELGGTGAGPSTNGPGSLSAASSGAQVTEGYEQGASTGAAPSDGWSTTMGAGIPASGATVGSAGLDSVSGTSDGPQDAAWGQAIVADANKYLGVPYQWGGTDPSTGVDCSGLVQDVFNDLGVSLPRTADEQSMVGTAVPSIGDAQPGDLVFFAGSDGTATNPGHVGIYIGNGEMIDAPYSGADVRVEPVSDAGTPTAVRRISPPASFDPSAIGTTDGTGGVSGTATLSADVTPVASSPYASEFAQASATYGVPQGLLNAVAQTESDFNPNAVSSAGAEGLMQLMPSTAASMGVDPLDPAQAIPAAAGLLASYHQQFGSWSLAVAAYNAGPNAVSQYSGVPPYAQTQAYVQNVMSRSGMEEETE